MKSEIINKIVIKCYIDLLDDWNIENDKKANNETVIWGNGSKLTSMNVVSLVIKIEEAIKDDFDVNITIADEKAMSQKNSPFRTIGYLSKYICKKMA